MSFLRFAMWIWGNETFAQLPLLTSNTFQFYSEASAFRKRVKFYHRGCRPSGWNYLMTAAEGPILDGTDAVAKKDLLKSNTGIDFDEIFVGGSIWKNETIGIWFASCALFGAVDKGRGGVVDVSGIVFGP